MIPVPGLGLNRCEPRAGKLQSIHTRAFCSVTLHLVSVWEDGERERERGMWEGGGE